MDLMAKLWPFALSWSLLSSTNADNFFAPCFQIPLVLLDQTKLAWHTCTYGDKRGGLKGGSNLFFNPADDFRKRLSYANAYLLKGAKSHRFAVEMSPNISKFILAFLNGGHSFELCEKYMRTTNKEGNHLMYYI